MDKKKKRKLVSVLLTLVMVLGYLPAGDSYALSESGHVHVHDEVYAEAEEHAHEDHDECGCIACTCEDCQCEGGECACDDCGDCGCSDCTCEDCQCEGGECSCDDCTDCNDCADCSCGACSCKDDHDHDIAAAFLNFQSAAEERASEAPEPAEQKLISTAGIITDKYGRSLKELLEEREAKLAEAALKEAAKHNPATAYAQSLKGSSISAKVLQPEIQTGKLRSFVFADWELDRDDAVYCEYCDQYIYGDWICNEGPHCSDNSSNEGCYSSEHCVECDKCEYTVCEDCFRCEVCWYHCLRCNGCFEPGDLCDSCKCCESCQDEATHCRDCGDCCMDDSGNYREILHECNVEGHYHCVSCAADYICDECHHCYYLQMDDFCGSCQKCMGCACRPDGTATHCWFCCDMDTCGNLCDTCKLCDSCQDYIEYEGVPGAAHCWECDKCVIHGGGSWCPALYEEGGNDMFHCTDCCENCSQCGKCIIAMVVDLCSDCGLCPECCKKNAEEFGCTHNLCIESSDFDDHVCPSCFACDGGEKCNFCGQCARCCENYHCHGHDWCPDAPGYDEHFCDNCGECADPEEFCDYCGFCLVCQQNETHCSHGVCQFGPEAYEHFCDVCDECIDEYCDSCGGHLIHCEEERESYGCEHDWTCPNSSDWDEHFCSDCGNCYEFSEFCDTCGLCQECCAERTEEYGCDHGICVFDSEWEDHFCFEHYQCLEYCIDDGLHDEECDHYADGEYCWDDENHWQHCTECEGRVDVESHSIVKTLVKSPTYADYGVQQWTCEDCGADLGLKRLPKLSLGDHTHTFGGDAACTICGYVDDSLARIAAEPVDVRCTVSDYQEDYSENTATFRVYAKGENLRYHWFQTQAGGHITELEDGEYVNGAGSAVLTVVVPTNACSEDYEYWCEVWNDHGKVISRHAKLKAKHEYYWAASGTMHELWFNGVKYICYDTHAQYCIGENCGTIKNEEPHNWELSWTVEYPATTEKDGLRSRSCLTCSQKEYRTIPKITEEHVHRYTELHLNDTGHWYECTCGRKQYSFVHVYDYDNWYDITPATETAKGLEGTKCTVCDYEKTRETDLIPHTHSYYTWAEITDGFADGTWEKMIVSDQYSHSIKCRYYDVCGETTRMPHRWAGGYTPIGYNDDGSTTFYHECLDCGYGESIRQPSNKWIFIGNGVKISDDEHNVIADSAGNCMIYADSVQKTGYICTDIVVNYGASHLVATNTVTSGGKCRVTYTLAQIPQSVIQSEDFNTRYIIFEAIYETCPHEHTTISGGFPAGCKTYGKKADTVCVVCGQVLTEGAPIDPLGEHNYQLDESTAITGYCSYVPVSDPTGVVGRGYEGDWVCTVCGDSYKGKKTKPTHNEICTMGIIDPDCITNGNTGTTYCEACGKTLERGLRTPRLDHEWHFADDWVVEPTTKRTGQAYAECSMCGEQKLCSMQNMGSLCSRLGFTEDEWRAKLDYTGEDWAIKVTVTSNQNAAGYLEYDAGDLTLTAGSFNWSNKYFDKSKLPSYTFKITSTGRNSVIGMADLNPGDSIGNIPFDYTLGDDGMSFTFTAPFDTEGAGIYYYYVSPVFDVEKDDGSTAEVPLADLITSGGDWTGQVENLSISLDLQPGVRSRSITLQDAKGTVIKPLSRDICKIYDRDGNEIQTARAGQKVRVHFDITDGELPPHDWCHFTSWTYVSGKPEGLVENYISPIQDFIMPDNDIVMNADYRANGMLFTVYFELGGIGTEIAERTVTGTQMIGQVADPKDPTGWWEFDGWYKEDSFIHRIDPENEMVHGSLTLYAKWKKRPAQVLYADVSAIVLGWDVGMTQGFLYDSSISDEAILADLKKSSTELHTYRAVFDNGANVDGVFYQSLDFSDVEEGEYKLVIRKFGKYVPVIMPVTAEGFTDVGDVQMWLYGDVTGDGKVRTGDATQIYKYLAGLITLSDDQLKAADVTGDGKVRTGDATQIYKYLAGLESAFDDL